MSEKLIKDLIKENMGVNVPLNICSQFIDFMPENYEDLSDDELCIYIHSDYLISEMIGDIESIKKETQLILDGKNLRFNLIESEYNQENGEYFIVIQNEENFTKYRVDYKIKENEYDILKIETMI